VPERDKSELLREHELDLQVANDTAFLYDGWIGVEFQLPGEYGQSEPITVPILVRRQDNQEYLITGFSVIKEVVKQGRSIGTKHGMTHLVKNCILMSFRRQGKVSCLNRLSPTSQSLTKEKHIIKAS